MEEKQLSKFFILELFKLCLKRVSVLELTMSHMEYHFLPSEEYKFVWQSMSEYYKVHSELTTIGAIGQQYRTNPKVTAVLSKLVEVETPPETVVIEQLEVFIKKMIFIDTHRELAEKYNKQDDDGAYELMTKAAEKISQFNITKKDLFNNIIEGMPERIEERKANTLADDGSKRRDKKIPTGILFDLDSQLKGGIDRGDTMLWMAPSGGGKSKAIKFSGYFNAKIGHRVIHIQGEGTKKEAEEQYDAAFIGSDVSGIESGMIGEGKEEELDRVLRYIKGKGGEIHLKAFEQFGAVTLLDVKKFMDEIVKIYGPIDLLLLDYLELFDPGDGKRYNEERHRREALANGFKNLCMEYDCGGITATQSMDVSHTVRNDEKFVLRREHISEFKGMVKPFSIFATINATDKEIELNQIRIHIDKLRKYKRTIPTFPIATMFDNERFYDNSGTQLLRRYGKTE